MSTRVTAGANTFLIKIKAHRGEPSTKQPTPERSKGEQHTTLKMTTNTHHNYYGTTPAAKLYFHGTKTSQKMTKTRKRNHAHGEVQSEQKCEPQAQEKKWRKQKTLAPQGGGK